MSKLTDELKEQHKSLVSVLGRSSETGIGSEEGRKLLFAAKDGLLAHLRKEDQELYPALNKVAEKEASIKEMLSQFGQEMGEITKEVNAFFAKYREANVNSFDFGKDLGRIIARLSMRIRREESILYPAYDQYVAGK